MLGVAAGATRDERLAASQALRRQRETGHWDVEKTGRMSWELSSGVQITGTSTTSEEWNKKTRYGHTIGHVTVGDHDIKITADDAWELDSNGKTWHHALLAKDRDRILEEALIPALQEIPAHHLDKLAEIRFDSLLDDRAAGRYGAIKEKYVNERGGEGVITLYAWNQHFDHGRSHGAGLAHTLKHEIGHHVWESILTQEDRVRYAKGLGLPFRSVKELTTRPGEWNNEALKAIHKTTMSTPITGVPAVSVYGKTNVWEDFAEFYRGYNFMQGKVDKSHDVMNFWDSFIPTSEYNMAAFRHRLSIVPLDRLRG